MTRSRALWPALLLGISVALITWLLRTRVGVGLLFDDGVYFGLAQSLIDGRGYTYAALPTSIPGIKYPPLYPTVLATGLRMGLDPGNLSAFRAFNSVFWGLAALGSVYLFARHDLFGRQSAGQPDIADGPRLRNARLPIFAIVVVAGIACLQAPAMIFVSSLLSEPLFLALTVAALLLGDRASGTRPSADRKLAEDGLWFLAGLLAGLAFVTRSIGLMLIVSLTAAVLLRRRWRQAALTAAGAALPAVPWMIWGAANKNAVPESISGHYGSYSSWYLSSVIERPFEQLSGKVAQNLPPILEVFRDVWLPRLALIEGLVPAIVLAVVGLLGLSVVVGRRPVLTGFLVLYFGLVLVFPSGPSRFVYAIMPLAGLLAAEAVWVGVCRLRSRAGRLPAAAVTALLLAVLANAAFQAGRDQLRRGWSRGLDNSEAAMAPIVDWVRENTSPSAVVGSALNTYVYWQTGRRGVPLYRHRPTARGDQTLPPDQPAHDLEATVNDFHVDLLALPLSGHRAANEAVASFVRLYPERVQEIHMAPQSGVAIYRVVPTTGRGEVSEQNR